MMLVGFTWSIYPFILLAKGEFTCLQANCSGKLPGTGWQHGVMHANISSGYSSAAAKE
jgi:hypothetical protein